MTDLGNTAARAKQSAAALRDARAILRRLDGLVRSTGDGSVSSAGVSAIAEARDAAERMVTQVVREDAQQRREAREAVVRAARSAGR